MYVDGLVTGYLMLNNSNAISLFHMERLITFQNPVKPTFSGVLFALVHSQCTLDASLSGAPNKTLNFCATLTSPRHQRTASCLVRVKRKKRQLKLWQTPSVS